MMIELEDRFSERETKNQSRKVLSPKEMDILSFINDFGFCEIRQIMNRFCIKRSSCYFNMQILMRLGFLNHTPVIPNRPGVYYLTHNGCRLLDSGLRPLRKIPVTIYAHQLTVVDVCLKLLKDYPDVAWISERRLIREKYFDNSAQKDHLPDGVLVFPDGKQVAIEVEITLKDRKRLEAILQDYAMQTTYREVWYFCSKGVYPVVIDLGKDIPLIKAFHLGDLKYE